MDSEIVQFLQSPQGFISLVIQNNLPAVNVNLQNLGIANAPVSADQAYSMMVNLLQSGKVELVMQALTVPFRLDATNGTEQYFPALVDARNELFPQDAWPEDVDWTQAAQIIYSQLGTAIINPAAIISDANDTTDSGNQTTTGGTTTMKQDKTLLIYVAIGILILILLLIALK